jgi:2,4-dienoyl-CoA reductase (NADPH2)
MYLQALFTPIRIGSMELRNRLVMSPMETGYATKEGIPSSRYVAYLEARARGGVGLITLGACTVDDRHREVPRSVHFANDDVIAAHRELTQRVHAHGAKVQPQIVHPGPDGLAPFLSGIPSIGPSVIPSYLTGVPCRELATDEIPGILVQFRDAARRVREAGYDGIELHAAHGYMLLGSFLTPGRNRRSDEYTGSTPEGRIRLIVEVVEAIKREVGSDFPLTLRISGYERAPEGRTIDDTQLIAPRLVAAGVDAFHVSGGVIDRLTTQMVTGSHFGDAHNVGAAAAVKRVVDVPVMTVGRIHDPQLAEQILRAGKADLIVMGRPLLADPELPNKAQRGNLAELRRCISCQNCIDSMESGRMACAVNAFTGREEELCLTPTQNPKRVVVIGGGPGGMEAARVAALRGHRVSLYEKQGYLGGALVMAATVHEDNEPFLEFLTHALAELGVDVHVGRAMTSEHVAALHPDAVIVATGGKVVAPRIVGDDLPHVLTGTLMRQMIAGHVPQEERHRFPRWMGWAVDLAGGRLQRYVHPRWIRTATRWWMPLGRSVVIVGADLAAIELAEFLAERGRRVSLLESGSGIAPEVGLKRRAEHMDRLDRLGISVNTGVTIERITPQGVIIGRAAVGSRVISADTVILAGEVEPDTTLYDSIRQRVPETYAVGDCTGLGLIRKAVEEAARVACSL